MLVLRESFQPKLPLSSGVVDGIADDYLAEA